VPGLCQASFSTKLCTYHGRLVKLQRQADILITTLQPVSRGTEGKISLEEHWLEWYLSRDRPGWLGVSLIDLLGGGLLYAAFCATNLESVIEQRCKPKGEAGLR